MSHSVVHDKTAMTLFRAYIPHWYSKRSKLHKICKKKKSTSDEVDKIKLMMDEYCDTITSHNVTKVTIIFNLINLI